MTSASPLAWSWRLAWLGAAYAVPGVLVTVHDPAQGIPLFIGVLCAAGLGLRPMRRGRAIALLCGGIVGMALLLGSVVAQEPWLAVVSLFVAGVVAPLAASRIPLGPLVLALGLPLFASGLSVSGPDVGVRVALLMLVGSAYAWSVSLCWPESAGPERPATPPHQPVGILLDYGVRLGITGALSVGLAFALGLDHPGWAPTAALMVSRPAPALSQQRDLGRACAVLVGSAAAVSFAALHPAGWLIAALCAAAVAAMTGTTGSRWYIATGFTTFVVLSLLLVESPGTGRWWFNERLGANLIGIAVAYLLMSVVPDLRARRRQKARAQTSDRV
jgi:hypothetical protein